MKLLTPENITEDTRQIVNEIFGSVAAYARYLDKDERDVRRRVSGRVGRRRGLTSVREILDELGYEVYYEIRLKKDASDDANHLLHTNHSSQGMLVHDGRECEGD